MQRGDNANGFSTGEEDSRGGPDQVCSLLEDCVRCRRPAGNASYSKSIQKIVTHRKLKLHLDPNARHIYICDYHKSMIQSARSKRKRKESEDDSNGTDSDFCEVDLNKLQFNTLRRYKRHFSVTTPSGLSKAQLAELLLKHFRTINVSDKDILPTFFNLLRNNGNKLDQKASQENA